jgi:hypothetical protein
MTWMDWVSGSCKHASISRSGPECLHTCTDIYPSTIQIRPSLRLFHSGKVIGEKYDKWWGEEKKNPNANLDKRWKPVRIHSLLYSKAHNEEMKSFCRTWEEERRTRVEDLESLFLCWAVRIYETGCRVFVCVLFVIYNTGRGCKVALVSKVADTKKKFFYFLLSFGR